jgi:hypothetical protein
MTRILTVAIGACALLGWSQGTAHDLQAQPLPVSRPAVQQPRHIGRDAELNDLRLVKSTEGKAIVRIAAGPLEMLAVGDRIGRHGAQVKEIAPGRLVLKEVRADADGEMTTALIVLRDGEQGGKRFLDRLDEQPPAAVRPLAVPQLPRKVPPAPNPGAL